VESSSGSCGAPFLWRISIADLTGDALFSELPSIDRVIVLLKGSAVFLTVNGNPARELGLHQKLEFPGDVPTSMTMAMPSNGETGLDLNLMWDRSRMLATVEILSQGGRLDVSANSCFVIAIGGYASVNINNLKIFLSELDSLRLCKSSGDLVVLEGRVFVARLSALTTAVSAGDTTATASTDEKAQAASALTQESTPRIIPYKPRDISEPVELVNAIRQRRGGELINLDRMLLHSLPVARGWNAFFGEIRQNLSVDARLRELGMCGVAVLNGAEYEFAHHAGPFLHVRFLHSFVYSRCLSLSRCIYSELFSDLTIYLSFDSGIPIFFDFRSAHFHSIFNLSTVRRHP
jgi:environmental stress-induced protein Ves